MLGIFTLEFLPICLTVLLALLVFSLTTFSLLILHLDAYSILLVKTIAIISGTIYFFLKALASIPKPENCLTALKK